MGEPFRPYRGFERGEEALTPRATHSVPANVGHANSPHDSLWYYLLRETTRSFARAILGVELPDASPVAVSAGHSHSEDQHAALDWWAAGSGTAWFSEGVVTEKGAAVVDQTTATDILWLPLAVPAGVSLGYFKVRGGTQAAADEMFLQLTLYQSATMNGSALWSSAILDIKGDGVSHLPDSLFEFDPMDLSALATEDGVKQGWLQLTGFVASGGQLGWVNELTFALRQGL